MEDNPRARYHTPDQYAIQWELFRGAMRQRRIKLGLTQHQVAERMGRSQDYVSNLENNDRSMPNLITVWIWVEALNGSLDLLWGSPADFRETGGA